MSAARSFFDQLLASLAGEHQSIVQNTPPLNLSPSGNPPWVDPPPGSDPFDSQNSIALPAQGSGDFAIVSFAVPPGRDGVIKRISANVSAPGFVQGSGDLIWRILRNGQAVRGYGNILTELGSIQIPRSTDGILIYENDLVQLVINNANFLVGGAFALGSLAGYFWPKA